MLAKKMIKVCAIHEVNGRSEIKHFFYLHFLSKWNEQEADKIFIYLQLVAIYFFL